MEGVIKDRLLEHLEKNNLLTNSQHGFRVGRSVVTSLLEYLEEITAALENGDSYDSIMTDFRQAFDRVQFKKMLLKLRSHGIGGHIYGWIENWMTGRKQRVVINGKSSSWLKVGSSVVQGSVIGPLLFLIFINDLDHSVKKIDPSTSIHKYADDSKLGRIVNSSEDAQCCQSALNALVGWCDEWGMSLHPSKCKVLHFGSRNKQFEYTIDGKAVESVSNEKDLGVIITTDLKSSSQVRAVVAKANGVLARLKRSVLYRDVRVFTRLYVTYVRPLLESAVCVWNPAKQEDINLIERVQRRALKCINGLADKSYEERLSACGLQSLEDRRVRFDLIETFRLLKSGFGTKYFQYVDERHDRKTRSAANHLLVAEKCTTSVRRSFFINRVVNEWNQLPMEVRNAPNVQVFKIRYDKFVLN